MGWEEIWRIGGGVGSVGISGEEGCWIVDGISGGLCLVYEGELVGQFFEIGVESGIIVEGGG